MKNKLLPKGYEPVSYINSEEILSTYEIYKNPEYDKVVPQILESVYKFNNEKGKESDNYPYFRTENTIQYLPKLDTPSEIFSSVQLKELHAKMPYYHQYTNLKRIFSISVDGCALRTFYDKCYNVNNSILAIKDSENNVFGAYASEAFSPKSTFFGTAECFLFTFYKENKIYIFNSTGINDHYIYCDYDQICFGCSDDYFSLSLTHDFLEGYSKNTKTYNNECLNKNDKFTIVKLELWGFEG